MDEQVIRDPEAEGVEDDGDDEGGLSNQPYNTHN